MKIFLLSLISSILLIVSSYGQTPDKQVFNTAKPWAYWWWMGSAVNEKDISSNLQDFAAAGFGGMHIIPIYGVKGEETNFIQYLSPKWVAMLEFTVQEAKRLHLGIDMTLGTGWPYGGSHVLEKDAAKLFKIKKQGDQLVLDMQPTNQKVKRAAPGGEGLVLDHFDKDAVQRYFQPFDAIFSKNNIGVRAFYNDSYEVYGANWTTNFFEKFKAKRGYDLNVHLDVMALDSAKTDREKRIWADYNQTLADLLLEDFTKPLVDFTHKHHKVLRNEAHGSPANVLDLYAASDVPESEFFGSLPYNIPNYQQDPDFSSKRFGSPDELLLKLASSAANVSGKPLVSSETATWLGNHFKVSLKQIKPIIDQSFIGGINHVFFHGVPYSPPNAVFPGWLFYASTNFNQQSHFWKTLPQLNGYIERCQTLLQNAKSDNDVLLYFPLVDKWHSVGTHYKTHALDVHSLISEGFLNPAFKSLAFEMQYKGYAFDFISDLQIQNFLKSKLPNYKTIVVPPVSYMPLETLTALHQMQESGIQVVFMKQFPKSVNGFYEVEKRQAAFDKVLTRFNSSQSIFNSLAQVAEKKYAKRETMRDNGLSFIRKITPQSTLYFISNLDTLFSKGTIRLASSGESVQLFNPLFQTKQFVDFVKTGKNTVEIPLTLASGESVFVEVFTTKQVANTLVKELKIPTSKPQETILSGTWNVIFIDGEPSLPKGFSTQNLASWTTLSPDSMAQYYSGIVRYKLKINALGNQINKAAWIDLGDVRESATVKLNGKAIGTAWCLPYQLPIEAGLLKKENVLEIDVTNLSINRIRYMDKQGIQWKKFYDINLVDINYKPFNAANWPATDAGLLGPVKIILER